MPRWWSGRCSRATVRQEHPAAAARGCDPRRKERQDLKKLDARSRSTQVRGRNEPADATRHRSRDTGPMLVALFSTASSAALAPKPPTRRGVLAAAGSVAAGVKAASAAPSEPQSNSKPWVADARIGADEQYTGSLPYDPWAHSSLFGLVPPPVAGTWSHQELVDAARGGGVASVQIAPQHDVVIAVSTSGRRYATPMLDDDFPTLLLETTRPDGSYPFAVLPMDESRAALRSAAGTALQATRRSSDPAAPSPPLLPPLPPLRLAAPLATPQQSRCGSAGVAPAVAGGLGRTASLGHHPVRLPRAAREGAARARRGRTAAAQVSRAASLPPPRRPRQHKAGELEGGGGRRRRPRRAIPCTSRVCATGLRPCPQAREPMSDELRRAFGTASELGARAKAHQLHLGCISARRRLHLGDLSAVSHRRLPSGSSPRRRPRCERRPSSCASGRPNCASVPSWPRAGCSGSTSPRG